MRKHFKEHKKFYIGVGTGVCIAGITYLIMRDAYPQHISSSVTGTAGPSVTGTGSTQPISFTIGKAAQSTFGGLGQKVDIRRPLNDAKPTYWAHQPMQSPPTGHIGFAFSNSELTNSFNDLVVNVVEREGRGHPGYMVRCLETGLTHMSQKSAAVAYGIHPNRMSDHLHGRLSNVDGYHFERICMAA